MTITTGTTRRMSIGRKTTGKKTGYIGERFFVAGKWPQG